MGSIRKIFTVLINNYEYDVFSIENRKHEGQNDTPDTWWLYHSNRLPDNILPPEDSEYFVPYNCRSMERYVWDISFTQRVYTKEKWDETRFSSITRCEMKANNKLIYAFSTIGGDKGLSYAMAKVQYLQTLMGEHPYNFFEPESENGRKICWYGLPATINVKNDTWEIGIIPEYSDELPKEAWWKELKRRESKYSKEAQEDIDMDNEYFEDDYSTDYINWGDVLSDQHIYWFRK